MAEPLRLFLVEDNDDFAYLMRKTLERAGHHVTICHSGADALIVLGHTQFHLVILDQLLPDMAGLDLLQTLQREGITTPVLFVTGYGHEQLAREVLRAGASDYVIKDPGLTFLTELPKRVIESVTRHRLQHTNLLLIEALESARDGIIITDLHGVILHVNQALERMFGFPRQELLGETARILKSGLHPPDYYAELWNTILNRASWQGEIVNRRKDGTFIDTSLTVSPIVDPRGQLTHFVGIYRDVSERKQIERQLFQAQKMQSVGTLAGGIAHEFNNLLAGIQGYAALGIREKSASPPIREFLGFIVELSERAANLTRQLLAFARKPALSRQPISMTQLLRATANLVKHTLKVDVRMADVHADDDSERYTTLADQNQLQQVLVNLALNARDALPSSAPQVIDFRLHARKLEGELPAFPSNVPAGDYIVLEVEDQGQGMASDVLAQALDPFFTTKDIGQGTGLGLPVAFGIVHGHQGFLTIDSVKDRGTCVRIYLPRLNTGVPSESPQRVGPSTVIEPETHTSRTILVIDDEQAVLDVVRRFLEIAGHTVHGFSSGRTALDFVQRHRKVDLVILDLMIPREEGLSNFRALRDVLPEAPILLCTGLVQAEQASHLMAEGACDLLRKPFRMNELWHAVNRCIQ